MVVYQEKFYCAIVKIDLNLSDKVIVYCNMSDLVKKNETALAINIQKVEDKIAVIRNLEVIADADVAE